MTNKGSRDIRRVVARLSFWCNLLVDSPAIPYWPYRQPLAASISKQTPKNNINNTNKIIKMGKVNKNEIITLSISILALLVSSGQLLFNSPFFTDIFSRPKLNYFEVSSPITDVLTVKNNGVKNANNVKINLLCWSDDEIIIGDKTSTNPTIIRDSFGSNIQTVCVKIEKIIPNQEIVVVIQNNQSCKTDSIRKTYNKLELPKITSVLSDEGYGIKENVKME